MKTEHKGRRIERLLRQGWRQCEVVALTGYTWSYVNQIARYGGYDAFKAENLRWQAAKRRCAGVPVGPYRGGGKRSHVVDPAKVIAAVDAGLSYGQAAQKFGLRSRNVVAGMVNRRRKGQA